jgi:hypothetical protein
MANGQNPQAGQPQQGQPQQGQPAQAGQQQLQQHCQSLQQELSAASINWPRVIQLIMTILQAIGPLLPQQAQAMRGAAGGGQIDPQVVRQHADAIKACCDCLCACCGC